MQSRTFTVLLSVGLATLASGASAQALCGGLGDRGQWIGGSESVSDVSLFSSYQDQMALVLGGGQYVSLFSVSTPTDIRVEAAARGVGDPVIELFDSAGNLVTSDDDSGGEGSARAEVSIAPGTYCLAMRSFEERPLTAFIRIGRQEHEPLTAGVATDMTTESDSGMASDGMGMDGPCNLDTAVGLALGETGMGSASEVPAWRFSVDGSTAVSVVAENQSADPYITIYDAMGGYVADNDDYDGLNSRLDFASPLAAGDYCIAMAALSDTTLPISVTVEVYDPAAAMAALYSRGEASPPLDGSVAIVDLGVLENRLRMDAPNTSDATWFSFDVPESGLILIEAIAAGGNGDPMVYLYDDLGRLVEMNDDAGGGFDSQITAKVNRGTYLMALREVNSGSQSMVRLVMERYVPAQ